MVTAAEIPRQQMTTEQWETTVDVAIGDLRATVNAQADLINVLMSRLSVSDQAQESLQTEISRLGVGDKLRNAMLAELWIAHTRPSVLATAAAPQNTLRVRSKLANTIKEGWRFGEDTAEWEGVTGLGMDDALAAGHLAAENVGQRMAALRNAPPAVEDDDPVCVCGTHKSEHTLCGCGDFERPR